MNPHFIMKNKVRKLIESQNFTFRTKLFSNPHTITISFNFCFFFQFDHMLLAMFTEYPSIIVFVLLWRRSMKNYKNYVTHTKSPTYCENNSRFKTTNNKNCNNDWSNRIFEVEMKLFYYRNIKRLQLHKHV